MITVWYSGDEAYHEFDNASEVGDWIGSAANRSIIAADRPGSTLKIVIGSPTEREAEVKEYDNSSVTDHGTTDRTTGIRIFLARLAELYDA